jgi:hypothetical protein
VIAGRRGADRRGVIGQGPSIGGAIRNVAMKLGENYFRFDDDHGAMIGQRHDRNVTAAAIAPAQRLRY